VLIADVQVGAVESVVQDVGGRCGYMIRRYWRSGSGNGRERYAEWILG
jgi:hypothetical protein